MRSRRVVAWMVSLLSMGWSTGVLLAQVPAPAPAPAPGPIVVQSGGGVLIGLGLYVVMAAVALVAVCKSSRRV